MNGEDVPRIVPNVPMPNASKTTTELSGPVMLGQEVPGRPQLLPFTPSRIPMGPNMPQPNPWSTTNGSHPSHQTNGSTAPPQPQDDSEMLDTQPDPYGNSQQRDQQQHITPSQQPGTQGQRSQKSGLTTIAHGSQLNEYHNSASTTTSGKKTSDRSSGPFSVGTQNSVPGHADQPDYFTNPGAMYGGSQVPDMPDTQPEEVIPLSQPSQPSQSSQAMPPPPPAQGHRQSSIQALLNNDSGDSASPEKTQPTPRMILDMVPVQKLHEELVRRSSGMSVEQLEQVNAQLMDVLWRTRGNWNRMQVMMKVKDAYNATEADIEACQKIMDPTQPSG